MTNFSDNKLKFKKNASGNYVSDLAPGLTIAPLYSRETGKVILWYIDDNSEVRSFKGHPYTTTLAGCYAKINSARF
jgi:hypothetical protein